MKCIGYGLVQVGDADLRDAGEKLKKEVLRRMAERWIPMGGVSHVVVTDSDGIMHHLYSQAIVLPEEDKLWLP